MRAPLALLVAATLIPSAAYFSGTGHACEHCLARHGVQPASYPLPAAAGYASDYGYGATVAVPLTVADEQQLSTLRQEAYGRQLDTYRSINRFGTGSALERSEERAEIALVREQIAQRRLAEQQAGYDPWGRARVVIAPAPRRTLRRP